jgi:hypothetical protein
MGHLYNADAPAIMTKLILDQAGEERPSVRITFGSVETDEEEPAEIPRYIFNVVPAPGGTTTPHGSSIVDSGEVFTILAEHDNCHSFSH